MDEHTKQELMDVLMETAKPEPIIPAEQSQINNMYSHKEVIGALVSYVAAWLYIQACCSYSGLYEIYLVAFGIAFTAGGLFYFREHIRQKEHWIWLSCMWVTLICECFGRNQVWGGYVWLFIHCFAIYWILCLSEHLMEGRSGAYILFDAVHGAISYPLKHFFEFLRTRVLWWGVRQIRPKKEKNFTGGGYVVFAVCAAVVLFFIAGKLLVQADANFGSFLDKFRFELEVENFSDYLFRFVLSIPVGAYLFGLVAGTAREDTEKLAKQKDGIQGFLAELKKVPNGLWTGLTACFVVFYLLFFGVQGSYLFGAFARNLPEGFTVAEYARQGFFELCGIMALNFCLLWLVCYSSISPVREKKSSKIMCTVLLAESILFAVTAMSKLILYIDCFGFTPLRLQSFWGVTVLMAGCMCSLVSLWTKKRTAGIWVIFTGVTLALLHLY